MERVSVVERRPWFGFVLWLLWWFCVVGSCGMAEWWNEA